MSKKIKIVILIGIILAVAYLILQHGQQVVKKGTKSCVDVPPDVQRWHGDMKADWGAYGPAKKRYIGLTDLESMESEYIDGFFKAIDAQPNSRLVRMYSNEIKAWLKSGRADRHWMVNLGELRCYDELSV
jgi:hypothetical protein